MSLFSCVVTAKGTFITNYIPHCSLLARPQQWELCGILFLISVCSHCGPQYFSFSNFHPKHFHQDSQPLDVQAVVVLTITNLFELLMQPSRTSQLHHTVVA